MSDPGAITPREIRKRGREALRITWSDDHAGEYPARRLRALCPCAMCVDEDTGRRRVGEDAIGADVGIEEAQLVGRYAVQLRFSDGHQTGIYSFDYLRAICGCVECSG
jgi:DUF971 family protein